MILLLLALVQTDDLRLTQEILATSTKLNRETYRLIGTQDDWASLWREHIGDDTAPPKVDFAKNRVVAHSRLVRPGCHMAGLRFDAGKTAWRVTLDIFDSQKDKDRASTWQAAFAVLPTPTARLELWIGYYVWGVGCNGFETIAVASPADGSFLIINPRRERAIAVLRAADGRDLWTTDAAQILTEPERACPGERGDLITLVAGGSTTIVDFRPNGGRRRISFSLEAGRPLDDPLLIAQLRATPTDPVDLNHDVAALESADPAVRAEAAARIRKWGLPQLDTLRARLKELGVEGKARLGAILGELDRLKPLIPRAKELTE